jgi:hypothetical protein
MHRELRASDAERAAVVQLLERAVGEGRISMAEFEQRVEVAHRAITRGELDDLTSDLPRSLW